MAVAGDSGANPIPPQHLDGTIQSLPRADPDLHIGFDKERSRALLVASWMCLQLPLPHLDVAAADLASNISKSGPSMHSSLRPIIGSGNAKGLGLRLVRRYWGQQQHRERYAPRNWLV
jgi:hypothetical protein